MEKFWKTIKAEGIPEILLYGFIGKDVTSGSFVQELKMLEASNPVIHIRINSGGGSIFEGIAMCNAIKAAKSKVVAYVDGMAGSMAVDVALSCPEVYMSKIARLMTHQGSGSVSGGTSGDMADSAALLQSLDVSRANIYAARTGKTAETCKADYLGNNRWFTADQAIAEGLVDGIYDAEPLQIPATASTEQEVWNFLHEARFAAIFNDKNNTMKITELSATSRAALNLGENFEASAVDTAIASLVAKANLADQFKTEKEAAEQKLNDLQAEVTTKEVTSILDTAVTEKKMTVEMSAVLKTQYAGKPTELKALVDTMKPFQSVIPKGPEAGSRLEKLSAMTYDQLDKAGTLEELKGLNIDLFKAKFKEKFGTDYKG